MDKSSEAFRTITEVAETLDLPQHVLRFWETRFSQIKPLKRAGGRRYYRPEDVQLITAIRRLLYDEGFTIRGVQRLLREKGAKSFAAGAAPPPSLNREGGEAAPPPGVQLRQDEIGSADERVHGSEGVAIDQGANGARQNYDPPLLTPRAGLDLRALEAVLAELSECRRILDGVLHPHG
ncbi:MAG: MerR family transcriptional regulator [Methylobacteriaceae bacterium]|nr:MerR family transcriptional regulator [Methylobacteriaceae bacterium]